MLRRIRHWLNVKTWDQAHVPLVLDLREGDLRAQLLGFPEEVKEEYIQLDKAISDGVDGVVAMTNYLQIGLNEKAMFAHDVVRKHETDPQARWVAQKAVNQTTIPARDRIRHEHNDPSGKKEYTEYTFPMDPKEHSPLAPRSAMLKPPKLTPDEVKAVGFVRDVKQISSLVEGLVSPKMKPSLKKKLKESEAGYQRVTIDAKGKIKKVKTKT